MYVPVRKDSTVIGLLSIQSYTPDAYTQEDLRPASARRPLWRRAGADSRRGRAERERRAAPACADCRPHGHVDARAGRPGPHHRLPGTGRHPRASIPANSREPNRRSSSSSTRRITTWSGKPLPKPSNPGLTMKWSSASCRAAGRWAGCLAAGGPITMPTASRSVWQGWPLTSRPARRRRKESPG